MIARAINQTLQQYMVKTTCDASIPNEIEYIPTEKTIHNRATKILYIELDLIES